MRETEAKAVIDSMDPYEKLLIYAAAARGEELGSAIKMQRLMFFCRYALPDGYYEAMYFETQKNGPYSQVVDKGLHSLGDKNLIDLPSCSLTEQGLEVSHYAVPDEPVKSVVDNYKKFICDLNEDELLALIYASFPGYQSNSDIWDSIKKNRIGIATSLMRKRAVSFSKAAEISGMDPDEFEGLLIEENVRWRVV